MSLRLQPDAQGQGDNRLSFSRVIPCVEFLLGTFRHIRAVLDSVLGTSTIQAEALGKTTVPFFFGEGLTGDSLRGIDLHGHTRRKGGSESSGLGLGDCVCSVLLAGRRFLGGLALDLAAMEPVINCDCQSNILIELCRRVMYG